MQDEYVQKTGLVSTALSFSDEQKKEVQFQFHLSPIGYLVFDIGM